MKYSERKISQCILPLRLLRINSEISFNPNKAGLFGGSFFWWFFKQHIRKVGRLRNFLKKSRRDPKLFKINNQQKLADGEVTK